MDRVSTLADDNSTPVDVAFEAALTSTTVTGPVAPFDPEAALSPFKVEEWRRLTPSQRLERAWALRARLLNPRDVHDRKLFPAP